MIFHKCKSDHAIFPLSALHWCFITHGLLPKLFTYIQVSSWSASAYLALLPVNLLTHSLWSHCTNHPPFQEEASSYQALLLFLCQEGLFSLGKLLLNLQHATQRSPSLHWLPWLFQEFPHPCSSSSFLSSLHSPKQSSLSISGSSIDLELLKRDTVGSIFGVTRVLAVSLYLRFGIHMCHPCSPKADLGTQFDSS